MYNVYIYINRYLKTTFMCRLVVFPSFVMDSSSTFRATASLEMWHDAQVGCQRRSVSQNTGKTVGGIYSSIQYIYIYI